MFPEDLRIALYQRNPTRAVAVVVLGLPPDAKARKRMETLEWSLFPDEDELAEIDRFTKADVLGAWKLAPPVITKAEWIFLCQWLFHPRLPQEKFNLRLRQEISGILPRLAMSTPESREQSLQALKETLSEYDGMGLDRLRGVSFIKAHYGLLFGRQSPDEGAWDAIFDVLDSERQRQQDQWDNYRREHPEGTVEGLNDTTTGDQEA
jgi:hypothetical protein